MEKVAPKIIKASRGLQVKAGTGDIPQHAIAKAEAALERNSEDFLPLAQSLLAKLQEGIDRARDGHEPKAQLQAGLTRPVMDLKANARMFKYELVTHLATIMLEFLEGLKTLDDTAIEIVAAHHRTLTLIVTRKMSGNGGEMGPVLQKELQSACQRYFAQKKA